MWHKSLFDIPGMTMDATSSNAMFSLDDDDVITSLDVDAFQVGQPRTPDKSYVGTIPQPESLFDATRARHEALARAVATLETTCEAFDSVDTSAVAAQSSLRRRVGSVAVACSALESVASYAESPDHEALYAGDGLLAPYLAGVYLWMGDVTDTLGALARDLNGLAPDWATFRHRLSEVSWIFDMAVAEARRLETVAGANLPIDMHESMDELRIAIVALKHKLDEPFG